MKECAIENKKGRERDTERVCVRESERKKEDERKMSDANCAIEIRFLWSKMILWLINFRNFGR